MLLKELNGVQWLEFELLAECKEVTHGCFLRHGGSSTSPYNSLNVGQQVGDNPENVLENHKKITQTLKLNFLQSANQCHGKAISHITHTNLSVPQCDAMTTQLIGMGLMIAHADCQATIFYDPINNAIANVHSGWRGSIQNIYANTITEMQQLYGSKPEDLLVGISPSLGPQSAEFIHYKKELPETFWQFRHGYHFDFWQISRWQLEEKGVLPSHIQIAQIDTMANPKDFFSYRYANKCGRNATVCALSKLI